MRSSKTRDHLKLKIGHLQNIQSFETSIETGNVQSYDEQCIVPAGIGVTSQLERYFIRVNQCPY